MVNLKDFYINLIDFHIQTFEYYFHIFRIKFEECGIAFGPRLLLKLLYSSGWALGINCCGSREHRKNPEYISRLENACWCRAQAQAL